jgi:hypothetical protein
MTREDAIATKRNALCTRTPAADQAENILDLVIADRWIGQEFSHADDKS